MTDIVAVAAAAAEAGADCVSLVNMFIGMAIDWRKRRPILGNVTGGLSGLAIKLLALRMVWQVARNVRIPVIGIGGIATIDDVMEFLVAGASAVQLGTVNFYDPHRRRARGRRVARGARYTARQKRAGDPGDIGQVGARTLTICGELWCKVPAVTGRIATWPPASDRSLEVGVASVVEYERQPTGSGWLNHRRRQLAWLEQALQRG